MAKKNIWATFLIVLASFVSGAIFTTALMKYQNAKDLDSDEINTLNEVIRGLKNLEEEVNVNLEDEINAKAACEYVLRNFENNEGVSDSLKLSLTLAWVYTHIQPDYGPVDYLTYNPSARISNNNLRSKILDFYKLGLPATVSESKIRQQYIERIKMIMPKWFKSINTNTYNYEAIEISDYNKVRTDNELLFHLKTQYIETSRYSYELSGMLKHILKIIEEAEDELNKLNSQ